MTSRWSAMRVGIAPTLVYVAPRARRSGGSPRPNLAPLLMERAMRPAVDEHSDEVVEKLEVALDGAIRAAGF